MLTGEGAERGELLSGSPRASVQVAASGQQSVALERVPGGGEDGVRQRTSGMQPGSGSVKGVGAMGVEVVDRPGRVAECVPVGQRSDQSEYLVDHRRQTVGQTAGLYAGDRRRKPR